MRTLEEDIEDLKHENEALRAQVRGLKKRLRRKGKQEEFREELVKFNLEFGIFGAHYWPQ